MSGKVLKGGVTKSWQKKAKLEKAKSMILTKSNAARALNIEKKFKDTNVAATTVAVAGTILSSSLNVVAQDDLQNSRTGRKITIVNLNLRGVISIPAAAPSIAGSDTVRIIVYWDKQTNKAAAVATDILAIASGAVNVNEYRNMDKVERFQILKDKTFEIQSPTIFQNTTPANQVVAASKQFKFSKKMNLDIQFDTSAQTGAIGTQTTNNLGVLAVSYRGVAQVEFISRLKFIDL